MLLPSAFSCDQSQPSRRHSTLFASPPASPPNTSHTQGAFIGNITNTCRSLQSILTNIPSDQLPPTSLVQLPTPPMTYAPPPLKLRLRSRAKPDALAGATTSATTKEERLIPRKKVVKRAPMPPPRGLNKRRRATDDDLGRADHHDESQDEDEEDDAQSQTTSALSSEFTFRFSNPTSANTSFSSTISFDSSKEPERPSTPKRARIAPEQIPLGLERSDFHNLHLRELEADPERAKEQRQEAEKRGTDVDAETDGELWSAEDDRVLVELVLEKLKLTKTEWQDCARSLGRDRHSVGRRWKSLVAGGDVGLKKRRAKLHNTWR